MRRIIALALASALAGCGWFGDLEKPRLQGERLSVLSLERRLEPDPAIQAIDVRLPRPAANEAWPQAGGYPNHAMYHLELGDAPREIWRSSVGEGVGRRQRIVSPPVVFGGRVYAMDAVSNVRAFDAASGRRLWEFVTKPKDERGETFGGGLAYAEERLFVTTGYGQVIALEAADGKEVWRQNIGAPIRAAPTVADGRVFLVTLENQLQVLASDDGRRLWTHSSTPETAGLLGGASPAVDGEVVVAAYSSAELTALRVENARVLWTESLAGSRRVDALSSLADIRGRPVIDRSRVYAVSHSGRMASVDLRTGDRVWEQEIGGTDMPWAAGEFLFVLSNDSELLCLLRRDGRVRWVLELPKFENTDKKKGPLRWSGPVLAGDRLIAVASNGEAITVSPYTGEALGRVQMPSGIYLAPVVADQTLYVLTDGGDLIAYR
jgi:outer membrane protein assembly factor BamB